MYEDANGDILRTIHEEYESNRSILHAAVHRLKVYSHHSIWVAPIEIIVELQSVISFLKRIDRDPIYHVVLNEIQDIMKDIEYVNPGTIAGSLVGCNNARNETKICPVCIFARYINDIEIIDANVPWWHSSNKYCIFAYDGRITTLNDMFSSHAWIILMNPTAFIEFQTKDIELMIEENFKLKRVSLMYEKWDRTWSIIPKIALGDLSTRKEEIILRIRMDLFFEQSLTSHLLQSLC